jgi:hypothetical protein
MAFTKVVRAVMLVAVALVGPALAAPVDLADLAARIEYGYYSNEPRLIEAARDALARAGNDDAGVAYYRALAAFRLAQLGLPRGATLGPWLDECERQAAPEKLKGPAVVEGWILVAACANLAARTEPLRSLLHQHRREQALDKAREIDPANPRIAVVEAWSVSLDPAAEAADVQERAAAALKRAAAGFGTWSSKQDSPPDWGEPEALAELGAIYLARGASRDARDLVERALLLAPDYDYATKLRDRLQAKR